MRIFIDTNSEWNGGYLSHLKGFLSSNAIKNSNHEIIVYGCSKLKKLLDIHYAGMNYVIDDKLPLGFFGMNAWRKNRLPQILQNYNPDVHFNPMGWIASRNKICPVITMSRNLQPFVNSEIKKTPFFSKERLRLAIAKDAMIKSYNRSSGLIFLSDYAKEIISPNTHSNIERIVIPHGVSEYFRRKEHELATGIRSNGKINLLYVSRIFTYKNHDNVILAVDLLRDKLKQNIHLTLIGGASKNATQRLKNILNQLKDTFWVHFIDKIPNEELTSYYHRADVFIFASSVENFPNILLEAMASGLPIACSNRRPMTDILLNSGEYFDPENYKSIAATLEKLIIDNKYRHKKAKESLQLAGNYSYEKMTLETLSFFEIFQ